MPVDGINIGEFVKVIFSFKHERFKLFCTSVSEAIPFQGMKNRGRSGIPTRRIMAMWPYTLLYNMAFVQDFLYIVGCRHLPDLVHEFVKFSATIGVAVFQRARF